MGKELIIIIGKPEVAFEAYALSASFELDGQLKAGGVYSFNKFDKLVREYVRRLKPKHECNCKDCKLK